MKKVINRVPTIFLSMTVAFVLLESVFYFLSPATFWFEYYEPYIEPVRSQGVVRFSSHSEYKQNGEVTWYDTLWCKGEDGEVFRGNTQVFSDYKHKGEVADPKATWAYNPFPDGETTISCRICSEIVMNTPSTMFSPSGYTKSQGYCSEDFDW